MGLIKMKLSKQQIEHVAKLARLGLTEKEKGTFQKKLSSILGFVQKLNEADTNEVEPTAHITGLKNVMREDKAGAVNTNQRTKILNLAPKKKDGYVKVKAIL